MQKRANQIIDKFSHYKYVIVTVLGILVVGFIDDNSFVKRIQYKLKVSDLKAEIETYNERNERYKAQLKELEKDPRSIEKIAREKYFMKQDDEDIFVLSDDYLLDKDLDTNNE